MFDIGWSEMAIVALVAIIVIGPRDLPRVARSIGRWMGKARAMAREFQRSLDEMAREAELDELKKELEKSTRIDVRGEITKVVDPDGTLERGLRIEGDDVAKPAAAASAGTAASTVEPAPADGEGAASSAPATATPASGTAKTDG